MIILTNLSREVNGPRSPNEGTLTRVKTSQRYPHFAMLFKTCFVDGGEGGGGGNAVVCFNVPSCIYYIYWLILVCLASKGLEGVTRQIFKTN